MAKKGWRYESNRHSLARKGIKTGNLASQKELSFRKKYNRLNKINAMLPLWRRIDDKKSIYFERSGISFGKRYYDRQLGEIQIHPPNQSNSYWRVIVSEKMYSSPSDFHSFKTKTEALKFAKQVIKFKTKKEV